MVKGGILVIGIGLVCGFGRLAQANFSNASGKSFVMKVDTVNGSLGHLVSVPVEITNPMAVGIIDIRLQYGTFSESLHSVTPAARVAGWEFPPTAVGDTNPGEIHIVGVADTPFPPDTALPMAAGSGEVVYLNFKVYSDSALTDAFLPISFVFNSSSENVMYDSAGNLIDSSQIDYIPGGINLRTTGLKERDNLPRAFQLFQNYPNPFNPQTRIDFFMRASGKVSLVVYDVLGRSVRELANEFFSAGPRSVVWDGRDFNGRAVGSGMYFYQLISSDRRETKKMILVK